MRVRADRPSYWIGETFDAWDGVNWNTSPTPHGTERLDEDSPFILPGPEASPGTETDLQTFYVVQSSPNLVFHADDAHEVWFPTHDLFVSAHDSIVSPIGLGPGAIYTVESYVRTPTATQLRAAAGPSATPASILGPDTELPHPYTRAQALAQSVTAGSTTTYDKVESLIGWIGTHTHYSTDIPPLAPGQDAVDEFLFGNRTGFCEQISTSLAVMLRSIGIPAREAVGYVPGPYNPITDLYDIQADDAHAWVQVWFPGYGWESFDPTAVVPLANPSPGSTLLHEATSTLKRLPWIPISLVLAVTAAVTLVVRTRRRRPRTWAERAARSIESAGRRAGRRRQPHETLTEYAAALDALAGDPSGTWRALAGVVEATAYGGRRLSAEDDRRILASVHALRHELPRAGLLVGAGAFRRGDGPTRRRSSPPPRAGGGSPSAGGAD
jgi:transglutaminase-like putative cysteine protease